MRGVARIARVAPIALVLAFAPDASALDAAELMATLAGVKSSSARFVETRHSSLLKEPLETRGRLVYRRPDRLEKQVRAPFEQSVTIEGERVVVAGKGNTPERSMALPPGPARALVESLRATLAGDLRTLERHFAVSVSGSAEGWAMTLLPRDAALGALVSRVDFAGQGARVQRIEVLEAGGDRTITHIVSESP